jgi:F0F1-type ATP synthase assembly protein I
MPDKNGFKIWYAVSFAFQLGFIIVVPIVGFALLGLWGDRNLQTSPFLLIVGIIAGVFITVYEAYHMLIPLIKSNSSSSAIDSSNK